MGSAKTAKSADAARTIDARIRKIAGVSFDAVYAALATALKEKYPPPEGADPCSCVGPWTRDVFDDVVIFSNDGKLYRVAYTFSGNVATLSGEPEEVAVTYAPVGEAAAPPAGTPDLAMGAKRFAETFKKRHAIAKRLDETIARLTRG